MFIGALQTLYVPLEIREAANAEAKHTKADKLGVWMTIDEAGRKAAMHQAVTTERGRYGERRFLGLLIF
jgi:hypothetical protein